MSYLQTLKLHTDQIAIRISDSVLLKVAISLSVGIADYFVGTENFTTMGMLFTLIVFDLVTALIAQYKLGNIIESRKALKTATKLFVYTMLVSGTFLTEKIIPGTTFLDNGMISFLAMTELISILENTGHMGYAIPKKMLNRLEDLKNKA